MFTFTLEVKYIDLVPEKFKDDADPTSGLVPKLPSDIFNPLMTKSNGIYLNGIVSIISIFIFSAILA